MASKYNFRTYIITVLQGEKDFSEETVESWVWAGCWQGGSVIVLAYFGTLFCLSKWWVIGAKVFSSRDNAGLNVSNQIIYIV